MDILYAHDSTDEPVNRDRMKVNSMFKLRYLISNYYLVLALIDLIFIIITLYHYNENNAHKGMGGRPTLILTAAELLMSLPSLLSFLRTDCLTNWLGFESINQC